MHLKVHGRDHRDLTINRHVLRTLSQLLVLEFRVAKLLPKLIVLKAKLLHLLNPVGASASRPALTRKSDRNKKAGKKKAAGKGQNKRNDPLKESGVTHILHLLNTSEYQYGGF